MIDSIPKTINGNPTSQDSARISVNNISKTSNSGTVNSQQANANSARSDSRSSANSASSASTSGSNANNTTNLSNLLRQLPQGQTLQAQVKSSQLLSNNDKALLQQTNPSLAAKLSADISARQNTLQAQPSLTQNLNRNLNQSELLKSPLLNNAGTNTNSPTSNSATLNAKMLNTNLFLVKLSVSQTNGQTQTLSTVTPHALKNNEFIKIGQQNQELQIQRSTTQNIQHAASDSIKHILPKQQGVQVLQQFIQQLQALPTNIQTQLLTKNTLDSLALLNRFTHSNLTLNNGEAVKHAMENSGVQLEAKLARQQPITNDLNKILSNLIQSLNSKLPGLALNTALNTTTNANSLSNIMAKTTLQSVLNTATASNTSTTGNVGSTTNSGSLLSAQETEKLASQILANVAATNTQTAQSPLAPNLQTQGATVALMRLFGLPLPAEGQAIALPKAIEQHLKLLIEKTQARIQLNQLKALGLDKNISEVRLNTVQQFFTEIPLRFNEQILSLQLSIHEQEYQKRDDQSDQEQSSQKEETNHAKQWQVFMSFDLPNNECLHTRLTIINDTVSATLWAESDTLCQKTNQNIASLRDKFLKHGLEVDELVCLKGKPPQEDLSLDYNLVDIKT